MIKELDLEKKVLSGLLQHQETWGQIATLLVEDDFYSEDSKVHVSMFKLIRSALNNSEAIDDTILIGRFKQLGTSFVDNIDLPEYVRSLIYYEIPLDVFLTSIKELKKVTFRRAMWNVAEEQKKFVKKVDPSTPYNELMSSVDKIHNDAISSFEAGGEKTTVNLSERAEDFIEGIANNPPEHIGFPSPYETMNRIYGSVLRGGNIFCLAARSKAGKTSFLIDMAMKTSYTHQVPIIHFDNGEMSERELMFRMVSGMSGIPQFMLEDGSWRKRSYNDWSAEEVFQRVRDVWSRIKKTKILYENVAGLSSEEMCSLLKRVYYENVGRGEEAVFSFDYLKTDFDNLGRGSDWAFVGKTLDGFKRVITKDLKFDGEPVVSMATSVQCNRLGITSGHDANSVQDLEHEGAMALSDLIPQFASWSFMLRWKTQDERGRWGEQFGTHNLIGLLARHLGEDVAGHINPVDHPDGPARKNFINLNFENFSFEDRGDFRDIVHHLENRDVQPQQSDESELPNELA